VYCYYISRNLYPSSRNHVLQYSHVWSSMYPLKSTNWDGNDWVQCISGKNGIMIIDLQFNHNNSKHFVGWFLGMNQEVLDDFEINVS